jgi:hypothetical protein
MTRSAFAAIVAFFVCSPTLGETPDSIKPGMNLEAAKQLLKAFGYDAESSQHQLAMIARDRSHELAFCGTKSLKSKCMPQRIVDSRHVIDVPDHAIDFYF